MPLRALAWTLGRGIVAGAVGTAAMTVSSTLEQHLRGREASTAPADATAKVLGIEGFSGDGAKARFGTLVHWGYGTSWGLARAALGEMVLSPTKATAAHFAAVWGGEQVMLPALEVAPPLTQWGAREVAIDAFHHIVYATATGLAYEALSR